jgi:hypothetical protein
MLALPEVVSGLVLMERGLSLSVVTTSGTTGSSEIGKEIRRGEPIESVRPLQ